MDYFTYEERPLPAFPEDRGEYGDLTSLWLAHFAALAYEERYKIARLLKEQGFTRVFFFDESGTQAYLARRPPDGDRRGFCVVAFRGTENDYKDILADITFFKRTIDYRHGFRAHGGFLTALNHVWGSYWKPEDLNDAEFRAKRIGADGITEVLLELLTEEDELYFTGHSLGGAIANLGAYQFERAQEGAITAVYTIGAPRTADGTFADYLKHRSRYPVYRVVNAADIVPRVPPLLLGFRHFGTCVYLTRAGERKIDPSIILLVRSTVTGLAPLLYRYTPLRWLRACKVRAFTDHGNAEYRRKLGHLVHEQ